MSHVTDELDKPKRPKKKFPLGKRPRRPLRPKRMAWYDRVPPDIDMMKPENYQPSICGCGSRKVDGSLCLRCLDSWTDE